MYIDDVISDFLRVLKHNNVGFSHQIVKPEYLISLGDLAGKIESFNENGNTSIFENVNTVFNSALYSTYISYLPNNNLKKI